MGVMLNESSVLDGYLMSQLIQFEDASPSGIKATLAVYMELNSTTQPQQIETIVQKFLNRLT